jgi:hypothetical protein
MRNYVEDAPQTAQQVPVLLNLTQQTLLELLNMHETAIRLNRAGKLTTHQTEFVHGQMKQDDDGTWLLSTIFIGTALVLSLIFLIQGLNMAYLLLGGFVFLGSFALYVTRKRGKRSRDLETRVGKTKGELKIIASEALSQYAMVIGDKMFPISKALAEKFEGYEMPVVAAYYTIGTDTLLSMEVLMHEKRKNDELLTADDDDLEVEQPLASWDKPKNTLAIDDTLAENEQETHTEPEAATQEQVSGSKRRF